MISKSKGRKYIWQYLSKHNQIIVQKVIVLQTIICLSEYITISHKSVRFLHEAYNKYIYTFKFDERKKYK